VAERVDQAAVERVREYLDVHALAATPAAQLEAIAGHDRYTIARHFRRAFGTSPDRYRTLRRLAHARAAIERGDALADVAAACGFADQSHLNKRFKGAFGITPGQFAAAVAGRGR
jgi:AraC-like DNA-binding protein